ncbi:MAG: PDGLE domain-containing protein [Thermoanaerobaculaceae bacterium]
MITALVLVSIAAIRPELVGGAGPATGRRSALMPGGLLVALALAALAAPFASSLPDGLEWVAAQLGFRAPCSRDRECPARRLRRTGPRLAAARPRRSPASPGRCSCWVSPTCSARLLVPGGRARTEG